MSRRRSRAGRCSGVTVIHRYGRIAPGENIVLVVTASSHREAAFAAAEFLMDYLKTQAPFWKQVESRSRQDLGRGQGRRRRRGGALAEAARPRRSGIRSDAALRIAARALTAGTACVNLPAMDRSRRPTHSSADGRRCRCCAAQAGAAFAANEGRALDRAADPGRAGAAARLAADRFHLRQAPRHPLSGRHADRRAEASGEIRRPRRRVRLRDVLRGGAGGGHRPRHRENSRPRCAASATTTAPCSTTSAITISPTGASATSRTASAGRSPIEPSVTIDKTVTWHREFGKHQVSMTVDRQGDAAGQRQAAGAGRHHRLRVAAARASIIITPDLIAFGKSGELLLRNASQSHGRVVEEQDGDVRHRQSGEIRDLAARGRKHAGRGAPLKKRKARAPRESRPCAGASMSPSRN